MVYILLYRHTRAWRPQVGKRGGKKGEAHGGEYDDLEEGDDDGSRICPPVRFRLVQGLELQHIAKAHGFSLPNARRGPDASRARQRLFSLKHVASDGAAVPQRLVSMSMLFSATKQDTGDRSKPVWFKTRSYESVRRRIVGVLKKPIFKAYKMRGPFDAKWKICQTGQTPALWLQRGIKKIWLSKDPCRKSCNCRDTCSFHFRSVEVHILECVACLACDVVCDLN